MNRSFLPGCAHMSPVQRAQVGEPLPVVARHLREQRALAVDDLVVREREDEVLAERVEQPKVSWLWWGAGTGSREK